MTNGEFELFSTTCPAGTPVERLVSVEGLHWGIEDPFETAETEPGLDEVETHSWHGWPAISPW